MSKGYRAFLKRVQVYPLAGHVVSELSAHGLSSLTSMVVPLASTSSTGSYIIVVGSGDNECGFPAFLSQNWYLSSCSVLS
ncbi:MAG: hypothetical protein QXX41_08425 [Nitrososphaerota archaeon]